MLFLWRRPEDEAMSKVGMEVMRDEVMPQLLEALQKHNINNASNNDNHNDNNTKPNNDTNSNASNNYDDNDDNTDDDNNTNTKHHLILITTYS